MYKYESAFLWKHMARIVDGIWVVQRYLYFISHLSSLSCESLDQMLFRVPFQCEWFYDTVYFSSARSRLLMYPVVGFAFSKTHHVDGLLFCFNSTLWEVTIFFDTFCWWAHWQPLLCYIHFTYIKLSGTCLALINFCS